MQTKTWAQWLRDKYPKGTKLCLKHMRSNPELRGTICIVTSVDDLGIIHADLYGREIKVNISIDEFDEI